MIVNSSGCRLKICTYGNAYRHSGLLQTHGIRRPSKIHDFSTPWQTFLKQSRFDLVCTVNIVEFIKNTSSSNNINAVKEESHMFPNFGTVITSPGTNKNCLLWDP